jgi:hypothetical protein
MQYILDGSTIRSTLQEIAITMRSQLGSARDAHVSTPLMLPSRNSQLDPVRGLPCSSISDTIHDCSRIAHACSALRVADVDNNNNRRLRSVGLR